MMPRTALDVLSYYSIRRYYVDIFLLELLNSTSKGEKILDLGGVKYQRRGVVDLPKEIENRKIIYDCANLSPIKNPEILCDISAVPIADEQYDFILLSEVLEHLSHPKEVLAEAFRLLKPNGRLYICTPYFFHVHPDPKDFARYSPDWYFQTLETLQFNDIKVSPQGTVFMVIMNIVKLLVYELEKKGKFKHFIINKIRTIGLRLAMKITFYLDEKYNDSNVSIIKYSTTGFQVTAKK